VSPRRFDLIASAIAALLLSVAGYSLWHASGTEAPPNRGVNVVWRCANEGDAGVCNPLVETERCAACHTLRESTHASALQRHDAIGCVACHGGDGTAVSETAAHQGLAALGKGADVPVVESRCALCHVDTQPNATSTARSAWARWLASRDGKPASEVAPPPAREPDLAAVLALGRALFQSLRCGACHAARDASPSATPLDLLALRSSSAQLVASLTAHAERAGVDLGLDEAGKLSVAARLRSLEAGEAAGALLHRAGVPGSSADEGGVLFANLRCAVCHAPDHLDLTPIVAQRTADWTAYYLANPSHANPSAAMPSLRLSAREASSLALHLVPKGASLDAPGHVDAAAATNIMQASKCDVCHTAKPVPTGPSLMRYGDNHNGHAVLTTLEHHAGYVLDVSQRRALATYALSHFSTRVREGLRVPAHEGQDIYEGGRCAGCHSLDDPGAPLSLYGEGLRVRPQWLFELLRAPDRRPVRPAYHPEWAYRDLVPADRVTLRMPTYALDEERMTMLVRFFDARDGATFPYATNPPVDLSGEALTTAIGDLTRKDRGACMTCHTVSIPDVARAREEGDKLAPPLALAHDRLRAEWIEACIIEPSQWVPRMPAFVRPTAEIQRLRDLVLAIRDRTVLPAPGAESVVPALGLGDLP
jgi:mono/diheme cytochrome c family protein